MGLKDRFSGHPWNKNPWSKHRQSVWRERALDLSASYPGWLRVGMIALGTHRSDGCADFEPGELQELLGASNPQRLSEWLRTAKLNGWITGDSSPTCLVVPPHAVEGGM